MEDIDLSKDYVRWHGFLGDPSWPLPSVAAHSDEAGRADQGNPITASEYLDTPEVLSAKMRLVAGLVRRSKHCCAYTGAGLSRASGIPDYATKAKDSVNKSVAELKNPLSANPTYAHCVLAAMYRHSLLHSYVQQNHDGLPQKAGLPQRLMNEIHGAWFDPSNPVVMFGGNLRSDLFQWMCDIEEEADLTLALGTSLSGMNADRMAKSVAKRSLRGSALGTVLVTLQRTSLDPKCAVRVWARLDDAFRLLAKYLDIEDDVVTRAPAPDTREVFLVPYNAKGEKVDGGPLMFLDLRSGARVRVCEPDAMNYNAEGMVNGRDHHGHFKVLLQEKKSVCRLLGSWWPLEAERGEVAHLPIVNLDPEFQEGPAHDLSDSE